jgi:hypothetical protein
MALDPNLLAVAALTSAAGWTMLYAGARKKMLDVRQRRRVCPACGRVIAGRTCTEH